MNSVGELINTRYAKPGQTIREHTDRTIAAAKYLISHGYIKSDLIQRILLITCEYHDYGKINKVFQKRVTASKKIPFCEATEVPHNLLSVYFLTKDLFKSDYDRAISMFAILYHHNFDSRIITSKSSLISEMLDECKDNTISQRALERFSSIHVMPLIKKDSIDTNAILLKGFLHKCDYAASANILPEIQNNFLSTSMERMMGRWQCKNPDIRWNNLQNFCYENQEKNIIVTAPTGSGKTEAALRWIGNNKGFYVLPLKVANNAIYDRIANNILCGEDIENRVALLHSDTKSKYLKDARHSEDDVMEYYIKTKQLSLPLSICTLDQIFDFVALYQGYEFKLATLSGSKIVIDEIQMYQAELLAALITGIKFINKLGGKFAIVTATLPLLVKNLIKEALGYDVVEKDFSDTSLIRHNVHVSQSFINADDIVSQYNKKDENNKILAICNSIEYARKLYRKIKEKLPEGNVHLLHSSFTKEDRQKKENAILNVGKTYCNEDTKELNSQKCIWISTSIVEASLDIDFDYLFTELSDLMSLFQRFGRVNRKGIKSIDEYNCFVYTKVLGDIIQHMDETLYNCSKDAILTVDGIITEQQKANLMNAYITEEKFATSDYMKTYKGRCKELESLFVYEKAKSDFKIRDMESLTFIPLPVFLLHKEEIKKWEKEIQTVSSLKEKYEIREKMLQLSVSLSIHSSSHYFFLKKKEKGKVKISEKEFISVLDCEYSSEDGVEMKKEKEDEKEDRRDFCFAEFL